MSKHLPSLAQSVVMAGLVIQTIGLAYGIPSIIGWSVFLPVDLNSWLITPLVTAMAIVAPGAPRWSS